MPFEKMYTFLVTYQEIHPLKYEGIETSGIFSQHKEEITIPAHSDEEAELLLKVALLEDLSEQGKFLLLKKIELKKTMTTSWSSRVF